MSPAASAAQSLFSARPRARGIGSRSGSTSASASDAREQVGQLRRGQVGGQRLAVLGRQPAGHRAARRPPRPAVRAPPGPPARRRRRGRAPAGPGGVARAAPARGSAPSSSSTAAGSQSASSSRRQRSTAAATSRTSVSRRIARDIGGPAALTDRAEPHGADAVRQPQAALHPVRAGPPPHRAPRGRRGTRAAAPSCTARAPAGAARSARPSRRMWCCLPRSCEGVHAYTSGWCR